MIKCPAFDCERQIPEANFCCIHHWKALPRNVRDRVKKADREQAWLERGTSIMYAAIHAWEDAA